MRPHATVNPLMVYAVFFVVLLYGPVMLLPACELFKDKMLRSG